MDRVRQLEKSQQRSDLPRVAVGDTVSVSLKVKEGDKERTQVFTGTVIGIRGGGVGETFTVRRLVAGEGVERILPMHSPLIEAIEVVSKGRVRRAKLGYLRARTGKSTRLTEVIGDGKEADEAPAPAKPAKAPAAQAPAKKG